MGNDVDDAEAPGIHAPHGRTGSVATVVLAETHDESLPGVALLFLVFVKASFSLGLFAPEPVRDGKSAAGGRSMLD